MGLPRFVRPKGVDGEKSSNLYVANCGPAVGSSLDTIASVFSAFGEVKGVYAADDSGARVIVSYTESTSAQAALKAMDGRPCPDLGGRSLHIRFSVLQLTFEVIQGFLTFVENHFGFSQFTFFSLILFLFHHGR